MGPGKHQPRHAECLRKTGRRVEPWDVDHRRSKLLTAALATAPLVSCSSSGSPEAASPPSSAAISPSAIVPSPSPAITTDPVRAAVLAQYEAWWAAIERTQVTNDVRDHSLADTMETKVFRFVVDRLTIAQGKHTYYRGHYRLKATVVTLGDKAGTASVSDCVDASQVQTYDTRTHRATGAKAGLADNAYTVTMRKIDGTWKVTGFTTKGGSCA
jgi:hypothetical protein